jgi:DNA-binding response OmpR family regulator
MVASTRPADPVAAAATPDAATGSPPVAAPATPEMVTSTSSQREFILLGYLMRHAGEVCSRDELLSDVWGYGYDPGSNVVDVCVRRLRSKMQWRLIETVRNVGYSFVAS